MLPNHLHALRAIAPSLTRLRLAAKVHAIATLNMETHTALSRTIGRYPKPDTSGNKEITYYLAMTSLSSYEAYLQGAMDFAGFQSRVVVCLWCFISCGMSRFWGRILR